MSVHPFFRLADEVGADPRQPAPARPRVFPNTAALELEPVERPWARWEGGALGASGLSVWRVRSTGHGIDLATAWQWSYHLTLQGCLGLTYAGQEAGARSGEGALMGPAPRRTRVIPAMGGLYESFVVLVDPARAGLPTDRGPGATGLVTATDRGALAGHMRFLAQELLPERSALHAPPALTAAGALVAELFAATARAREEDDAAPTAGHAHVHRAEEIMRARLEEPLRVAELAAAVGIGPRALQAAFATHRGKAPREVLTEMRLDAAQRRLVSASPDQSVTDIALGCGFAHLSRFAAAYRRRFGEPPSETLARAHRAHFPAR